MKRVNVRLMVGLFSDAVCEELAERVRAVFTEEDRREVERALRRGMAIGMERDAWLVLAKRLYRTVPEIERAVVEYRKRENRRVI